MPARLTTLAEVKVSLRLLPRRDRFVLLLLVLFQFALAILDLFAIAGLGLATAVAANRISSSAEVSVPVVGNFIGRVDGMNGAFVLAVIAGCLMIIKSALSFWGTRRSFRFLANRQAFVSTRLADALLSRPLLQIQQRSSQETSYALTIGVQAMTVLMLGQAVVVTSEVSLIVVLLVGLLWVDPLMTVFTGIFFASVAIVLHVALSKWAIGIGKRESEAAAASIAALQESLQGYREVSVSGRRQSYTQRFNERIWEMARAQSHRLMIASIGKYVFEVALIVGAGLLLLTQLPSRPLAESAALIVVFMAAASRMMPALLRLQSAILNFKLAAGTAQMSIDLVEDLRTSDPAAAIPTELFESLLEASAAGYPGFDSTIKVCDVSFAYPGATEEALKDVVLSVEAGTSLALVGSTGAGKSTLGDVILGVIEPDQGYVTIGGVHPSEAVRRWPGALAYVPQDIGVINGTVRDNVALGLPPELVSDDRVWEALTRAHLRDFVASSQLALDTEVGEYGVKLSGGQRQRLGLARSLYSRPRLLVMDEATSALDSQTEADITGTIQEMNGNVTLVVIAHRLATIRNCDQVAYLEKGRVVAVGTFDEVRRDVSAFDRQATLLGL